MEFLYDIWYFVSHQGWVWWGPMLAVFGFLGIMLGWNLWYRGEGWEAEVRQLRERRDALRDGRGEPNENQIEDEEENEGGQGKSEERGESKSVSGIEEALAVDFAGEDVQVKSELGIIYRSRPAKPDNLKKIKGIGPVLERKLNKCGVYRFKQIALWEESHLKKFQVALKFPGRIQRDRWVEQAAEFAKEDADAG